MKTMTSIALAAALMLGAAAPAFAAGEGNGDPFAYRAPGVTVKLVAGKVGSIQNPFPYAAPPQKSTATLGADVGSDEGYNAANSMPSHALDAPHGRSSFASR